jgi:hypothetical protein
MVEAVQEIDRIDPHRCRAHVRDSYSPSIMAANYERLYEQLVERPFWEKSPAAEKSRRPAADATAAVA